MSDDANLTVKMAVFYPQSSGKMGVSENDSRTRSI